MVVLTLLQLGEVAVVEGEGELVVMTGDDEVRHDVAGMGGVNVAGAGLGVEAADASYGSIHLFLGEVELLHDTAVVMCGKGFEAVVHNGCCPADVVGLFSRAMQLDG